MPLSGIARNRRSSFSEAFSGSQTLQSSLLTQSAIREGVAAGGRRGKTPHRPPLSHPKGHAVQAMQATSPCLRRGTYCPVERQHRLRALEPFAQRGLSNLLSDKRATRLLLQLLLNDMDRIGQPRDSYQPTYEDFLSDDSDPNPGMPGQAMNFSSQLKDLVVGNKTQDLQSLIQQQPDAWSAISSEELGNLLLAAVKKGYSKIVVELIQKSAAGKAAAIPMETQLELLKEARCARSSSEEMSALLNTLLPDADFPVQHLEQLFKKACAQGQHALATELSAYKNDFVKNRERRYELAIHDAAAAGDLAKLQKELDAKLGIPPLDNSLSGVAWFFNALHRWVMEIFSADAAKALVNQQMGNVSLLHAAVASNNAESVFLLLEKGADISALDRHGRTALMRAREQSSNDIENLLTQRHALEGAPVPARVPLSTQAAAGRDTVAAQASPTDESAAGRSRYRDAVKTFKTLFPDIASVLLQSEDLARELNDSKPMSLAQAELFTAGYMADFQPPQALDVRKIPSELVPQGSEAVDQLSLIGERFRNGGVTLEASREMDIHRFLDSLLNSAFADVSALPEDIRRYLGNIGLCNLLISLISDVLDKANKHADWPSASDERRKEIFITLLERKLRRHKGTGTAMKGQDAIQALYDQLLRRQIAMLENYCKAAKAASKVGAWNTTDFSHIF